MDGRRAERGGGIVCSQRSRESSSCQEIRATQEQSRGEKTGETLMCTPDLRNWVKRLETQKEAQITVPQHLCPHTLSRSLSHTHRSINTVCYQQYRFTVSRNRALPHIHSAPLTPGNTATEVPITTLIQGKTNLIDPPGTQFISLLGN